MNLTIIVRWKDIFQWYKEALLSQQTAIKLIDEYELNSNLNNSVLENISLIEHTRSILLMIFQQES